MSTDTLNKSELVLEHIDTAKCYVDQKIHEYRLLSNITTETFDHIKVLLSEKLDKNIYTIQCDSDINPIELGHLHCILARVKYKVSRRMCCTEMIFGVILDPHKKLKIEEIVNKIA